jgi:predicted GIY-YIG superfamily endonuclease
VVAVSVVALVLMVVAGALLLTALGQVAAHRPQRSHPVAPVRPARKVRTNVPHVLYHYLHATRPGRIYIGISNSPEVRHSRHLIDPDDREWMRRSTKIMYPVQWYPSRTAARAAERAAVREAAHAGEDIANDQHHPYRRRSRAIR